MSVPIVIVVPRTKDANYQLTVSAHDDFLASSSDGKAVYADKIFPITLEYEFDSDSKIVPKKRNFVLYNFAADLVVLIKSLKDEVFLDQENPRSYVYHVQRMIINGLEDCLMRWMNTHNIREAQVEEKSEVLPSETKKKQTPKKCVECKLPPFARKVKSSKGGEIV